MHFVSASFAYFVLIVLTGAWLLRRAPTAHKLFLLGASYLFYAGLRLELAGLLLGSSLLNWAAGQALVSWRRPVLRWGVLWLAILANLGLLGAFKYYGLLQETARQLGEWLDLAIHLPLLELLLPLGISFYTFQGLAYVIDLHRGSGHQARSLLDFLLFIAFFPKLLAGPITRAHELLPQIEAGPPSRLENLGEAGSLIASGLFKKAVLANFLGSRLVEDAFVAPENYGAPALLLAAYAYSIQLYCDFSGYTDMARGIAALLGYKLPENFRAPYAATDPGAFWRRWHATFSSWLRDYVYYPLGGSRHGLIRTCVNLVITFTLCGLWHGPSAGYVLWGAIHGVALSGHKVLRDLRRAQGTLEDNPWWWRVAGWTFTFHLVVFSRIVFRAEDLATAQAFARRMVDPSALGQEPTLAVAAACLLGLAMNFVGAPLARGFTVFQNALPRPLLPLVWTATGVALLALQPTTIAAYIYFQF